MLKCSLARITKRYLYLGLLSAEGLTQEIIILLSAHLSLLVPVFYCDVNQCTTNVTWTMHVYVYTNARITKFASLQEYKPLDSSYLLV